MSKLLIPLIAIFVIAWLWRGARDRNKPLAHPARTAAKPAPMIPCAHCGVHVPQDSAIRGAHGAYCCEEHLHAAHDTRVRSK